MSLYGSLISDGEDDPFFGPHMRHMRQMNNMMNSLFSDPFGMFGGEGPLAITGPHHALTGPHHALTGPHHAMTGPHHGGAMMPFMPQMPSLNRVFADFGGNPVDAGTSFSSSTVIMSSGPNGNPQVFSSSSSTKVGPNGVKETRKTLQDSRTGTKKMSIGHHIGERAHLIERKQNVYTGDAEEHQEFINLEEEEAEHFDKEFQDKVGMNGSQRPRAAICAAPRRETPRLALPAPPVPNSSSQASDRRRQSRPSARRPLHSAASPLALSASTGVRDVYGGLHPQRHRFKHHKTNRYAPHDH